MLFRRETERNMSDRASPDDCPSNGTSASKKSYANETERRVARIFAEILDLQWAGREDDIFSLGGDSFEAVRIALELERQFQIQIPTQLLEGGGRVMEIASWIDTRGVPADRREPNPEEGSDFDGGV